MRELRNFVAQDSQGIIEVWKRISIILDLVYSIKEQTFPLCRRLD